MRFLFQGVMMRFLFSPQRLEVLHVHTGGSAELGLVLNWSVPVQDDQVSSQLVSVCSEGGARRSKVISCSSRKQMFVFVMY